LAKRTFILLINYEGLTMSGFRVNKSVNSAGYAGLLQRAYIPSSNSKLIAPGDLIVFSGAGDSKGTRGAVRASSSGVVAGVVAGIDVESENNINSIGLAASTAGYVDFIDHPDAEFIVDTTATLNDEDIGLNANATFTDSTSAGGIVTSGMKLDSSTKATTATLQFRIVGLAEDDDGVLGNRAIVRLNNVSRTNTTGA
jgi:hypothetical protein